MRLIEVLALTTVALGVVGCDEHDLGKTCGIDEPLVPAEPVGDEQPTVEVVGLQRDGACESFQCLTHAGLPPYCTRECSYEEGTEEDDCTTHDDCGEGLSCNAGVCQRDTCEPGFVCAGVQEVGPLAGKTFCVRRPCPSGDNIDCGDTGSLRCEHLACYNAQDRAPESQAVLVCESTEELNCECEGGGNDCGDDDYECTPESGQQLVPGTVTRSFYCQRTDL